MTSPEIPPGLFADRDGALRRLRDLERTIVAAGGSEDARRLPELIPPALRSAPDPDAALTGLLRVVEATPGPSALLNDLARHPVLLELLVRVCGSSQYFSDILVRDPELFRWLTASDALIRPRGGAQYDAEARRIGELFGRHERRLDALRRLARREILHIGTRDILALAGLEETVRALSELADVLAESALAVASSQMAERFPRPPRTPFALIGLGKLGGRELNYSSDVDLLAVYGEEGEVEDADGRSISHLEYFHKLVERTVQNMSRPTAEGYLYRVDMRLRPESGAGPLARSVAGFLTYYESRGELWERQMLIKARVVAGDRGFGGEFLGRLLPFVYPRTFFESPLAPVRRMKERIESEVGDPANIKTCPGGIRDVEFIVQALQLINGGRLAGIRTGNTLEAVTALQAAGILGAAEGERLADAYRFYRSVEHRLQLAMNTQTHSVPPDDPGRTRLARSLGLASVREFAARLEAHLRGVREVFNAVLGEREGGAGRAVAAMLDGAADAGPAAILATFGFREPSQAVKDLRLLARGASHAEGPAPDGMSHSVVRGGAEELLKELAGLPDPDFALRNLAMLGAAQRFPDLFLKQLLAEQTRHLLLRLVSRSLRVTRALIRDPLLLERLIADPAALEGGLEPLPPGAAALAADRWREEVRLTARHLLGIASFEELTRGLTALADGVVSALLAVPGGKKRAKPASLAVFALGKFGTGELGLDADLDLLFITGEKSASGREAAEKAASGFVRRMAGEGPDGRLYEVDARLRPEGKNAPLVAERHAYGDYLRTRASLWERQSLTRLRFVAGDRALAEQVLETVRAAVYDAPLPAGWVEQVVAMRRKTETRSRARGAELLDVKLGPGGMVDLEFLAQMGLLAGLLGRPSGPLTTAAALLGVPPSSVEARGASRGTELYSFFRSVEFHLRSVSEERGSILPEGPSLDRLGRVMGFKTGEGLSSAVAAAMRETRAIFLAGAAAISQRVS